MKAITRTLPILCAFILLALTGCDRTKNIVGATDDAVARARAAGEVDGASVNDRDEGQCSKDVIPLFVYARQDDTVIPQFDEMSTERLRPICVGAVTVTNDDDRVKIRVKSYDGWYIGGLALHIARELKCIPKYRNDGWRYERFMFTEVFRHPTQNWYTRVDVERCRDEHGSPGGPGRSIGPAGWEGDRCDGMSGGDGVEDPEVATLAATEFWDGDHDGFDHCGIRIGKIAVLAGEVTVIRRVGNGQPTETENLVADAGTMDAVVLNQPPNNHGVQIAIARVGDRSLDHGVKFAVVKIKRCTRITRGAFFTADQGDWGKPGSKQRNPAGLWRDQYFSRAFPRGLVVGDDKWVKLTCARAVSNLIPIGGTLGKLRNCYIDPDGAAEERVERETGSLLGQVIALGLNIKHDYWTRDYCGCDVDFADLVVTRGTFRGWRVWQVYAEANKILGAGRCRYTPAQINLALIAINTNFARGDCGTYLQYPELDL